MSYLVFFSFFFLRFSFLPPSVSSYLSYPLPSPVPLLVLHSFCFSVSSLPSNFPVPLPMACSPPPSFLHLLLAPPSSLRLRPLLSSASFPTPPLSSSHHLPSPIYAPPLPPPPPPTCPPPPCTSYLFCISSSTSYYLSSTSSLSPPSTPPPPPLFIYLILVLPPSSTCPLPRLMYNLHVPLSLSILVLRLLQLLPTVLKKKKFQIIVSLFSQPWGSRRCSSVDSFNLAIFCWLFS